MLDKLFLLSTIWVTTNKRFNMNKAQKMKTATRKTRKSAFWNKVKKVILFPVKVLKKIWNFIVRMCTALWRWLKSIDIVGMINLTLLVAIIVLFTSLIVDVVCCKKHVVNTAKNNNVVVTETAKSNKVDNRKVVQRKFNTALPLKADKETGITPKIKVVGVKKPVVVKQISLPANELPQQKLFGDVIVDSYPDAPMLSNGVDINGNLFVQNLRKYTLPCDAKISGHLFIRNVERLNFCGKFTVKGNIYVNRQSSFGPLPKQARIGGQVVL